jgi:hypothetical protein
MTVENCIKLLHAYKKQEENPIDETGKPLGGKERIDVIEQSKENYEMMKKHILNSKKFKGHPIIAELQGNKGEVEDGKKSKR